MPSWPSSPTRWPSAAKAVRDTDAQIAAKQQQLDQLRTQRTALEQNLDSQRAAIADLLRATYAIGQGSDLRLLLGDEDVARISRSLAYSKYFQQDRLQQVQQLMADLAKLQDLETQITASSRPCRRPEPSAATGQDAGRSNAAANRNWPPDRCAIQKRGPAAGRMKQNEQSLDKLVDKLQKAIDEAAREAAAREAAAREAAAKKHPGHQLPPPPIEVGKAIANIRGNLPWPASGAVNNYGNGVLIRPAAAARSTPWRAGG